VFGKKNKCTSPFVCVTSVSTHVRRFDFVFRRKLCEAKIVSLLHSHTIVLYSPRAVVDICRTCPREMYRAQFTKRAVRRIDHDFTVATGRASRCGEPAVNSYRKLIQDNYHDETLKHINCRRVPRFCRIARYCNVSRTRITESPLAILVNATNILFRLSPLLLSRCVRF